MTAECRLNKLFSPSRISGLTLSSVVKLNYRDKLPRHKASADTSAFHTRSNLVNRGMFKVNFYVTSTADSLWHHNVSQSETPDI